MSDDFNQIIKFTLEIDGIKNIYRRNLIKDGQRRENDAEHSWHIALMAMLFKDYYKLPVDLGKTIQMLLIHDLVELYAGDTYAYDKKAYEDKEAREKDAAEKLFGLLPLDLKNNLQSLWLEFEDMHTNEAIYASVLDRFQPFLLNYYNNGRPWIENKITKSQVLNRMSVSNNHSPEIWAFINQLINDAVANGYLIDS